MVLFEVDYEIGPSVGGSSLWNRVNGRQELGVLWSPTTTEPLFATEVEAANKLKREVMKSTENKLDTADPLATRPKPSVARPPKRARAADGAAARQASRPEPGAVRAPLGPRDAGGPLLAGCGDGGGAPAPAVDDRGGDRAWAFSGEMDLAYQEAEPSQEEDVVELEETYAGVHVATGGLAVPSDGEELGHDATPALGPRFVDFAAEFMGDEEGLTGEHRVRCRRTHLAQAIRK
jgi:hypothetical protein